MKHYYEFMSIRYAECKHDADGVESLSEYDAGLLPSPRYT